MTKAKLIAMNDTDEYEVILELNGIKLLCFAVVCPYKIDIGKYYPIELSLNVSDKTKPLELNKEIYDFEKIGQGYEYILRGKLNQDKLDLGFLSIQDDFLLQFPLLDGKHIEIEVLGLWVTFLL